jgi:hypothetical protein
VEHVFFRCDRWWKERQALEAEVEENTESGQYYWLHAEEAEELERSQQIFKTHPIP